jgi:aspartate aminotransferase
VNPFRAQLSGLKKSLIRQIFDAAPAGAINLGLGMPDLPVPAVVAEAVAREAATRRAAYTPNAGLPELRARIGLGAGVGADQVIVTAGVQEGLFCVLASLAGPGDEILVPDPGFPAYEMIATVLGASVTRYDCGADVQFRPTSHAISAALTDRTRAVVINSPGNPTGAVCVEVDGICEVLRERGVPWVSDEIYDAFVWSGEHRGFPADAGFVLGGLSKTANLMGWRLGWVLCPAAWAPRLTTVHQTVATCASRLAQVAGVAALEHASDDIATNVEVFRARREGVAARLSAAQVQHAPLDGAFYAFVRVGGDDLALARTLLQRGVITIPGSGFGPAGAGWLRVAYTTSSFLAGLDLVLAELRL